MKQKVTEDLVYKDLECRKITVQVKKQQPDPLTGRTGTNQTSLIHHAPSSEADPV